ncbi:DUF3124 domain-containing protein [Kovacikia minuta CCNUW1]|uniref:DUF3124 domain-containing protein n=1 Tax=Kovacikia minuta TaxID=2931930 RepID=UPI001CCDE13B|nr:DUF3124 domain-containing protein [Kovacikia minuta]UBF24871.1 DUF3124 domain-containing protein [Kovacikia minuta CCNUW1]
MRRLWLSRNLGAIALIALAACTPQATSQNAQTDSHENGVGLKQVTLNKSAIKQGQTVYVPVYSYIYHYNNQRHVINLAVTLSVRNTDLKNPIIITAVRYYDNDGKLIKQYLEKPVELAPLASTSFFIETNDTRGGLGANFIVDWVAETVVTEPVIEAVMIGTASTQGISFVSGGRVIQRFKK